MDKIAVFKHVLCEQCPILSKTGSVSLSCDPSEIIRQNAGKRVLVLLAGVQGCGKTTYCTEHFSSDCTVVNPDEISQECLETEPDIPFKEINKMVYETEMRQIYEGLKNGIIVLDTNCIDLIFRSHILETFKRVYDKTILIALNRDMDTIKKQVLGQILIRSRPGLYKEIEGEFNAMNFQLKYHIFEMGVDELYVV